MAHVDSSSLMHLFSEPEFWVAISSVLFFSFLLKYLFKFLILQADSRIQSVNNQYQSSEILLAETQNALIKARKRLEDFQSVDYAMIFEKVNSEIENDFNIYKNVIDCKYNNYCKEQEKIIADFSDHQAKELKNKFIRESIHLANLIIKKYIKSNTHYLIIQSDISRLSSVVNK